jgi:glycosyltransferase involved in cell wall biosynthesis
MNAVVIATYNEAESIGALLAGLRDFHCIVVDDSSPDGTGAIVRTFAHATLLTRPAKLGIASAYVAGLRAALATEAEWIVQMDAGGTHRPEDAEQLVQVAELFNADLVIGSRFLARGWRGYRTAISLGAAWLMRRLGVPVHDATSGFRCWRADFLRGLDLDAVRARGFAFQLELLYQAHRAGGSIVEMPIPYTLTTSTFNGGMVREALGVWMRLARGTWL